MAMANLQIAPQVPSEFTPAMPSTSSDFVVSRRMREYISDGARSFSFDTNNIIKFTLNSADAFLDGRNSWIQFKLFSTYAGGDGGITAFSGEYLSRFLESGGAHALFSRLRISLSNGTIISDYDYSQLYAMIRQHTMSAPHLQFQEGCSSYDSLTSDLYEAGFLSGKEQIQQVLTFAEASLVTLVGNTGVVAALPATSGNGNLAANPPVYPKFLVGDEIIIAAVCTPNVARATMPAYVRGKILSITSDTQLTITNPIGPALTFAAGEIAGVYKVIRGDASHRYRGAQGTSSTNHVLVKMKLFSDFFNNIKYLPLPFLRNLTIELTLNRPAHSVVFSAPAVTTPTFSWSIEDPVVVANLVTPSESLMNAYVEQYNSEQGIMLHWIDYQSNKRSIQATQSESVTLPSNCHSALAIVVAQKLPECQGVVSNDSWRLDTNGTSTKGNIQEYQFQCGSEFFPFGKPVNCGIGAAGTTVSISNGNAWNYVLQALDSHGAKYECSSIVPAEYYANNSLTRTTAGNLANESLRFYMAARLDRDGNYTGIDTSNNDLQLNISRSAAPANYAGTYLHSFIVHNRLMRISKASSIVFS